MSELQRLLTELPRPFRRDAVPTEALILGWPGAGALRASITSGVLLLEGEGGAPSASVALEGTLADVVLTLQSFGCLAILPTAAVGALPAAVLLDEGARDVLPSGIPFVRWTNPLWRLLAPVAAALRAAGDRIAIAMGQLNLLTAAAEFADYWGLFTGIARRTGEADEAYTSRQLDELLRPRENNEALALLIEHDTGHQVIEVRDLRRDIFRCSAVTLRHHPLAGRRYNAAVVEIRLADFGDLSVEYLARLHVAAGVLVLIVGQLPLRLTLHVTVRIRGAQVGQPPAFIVGTSTVGVGSVGVGS